MGTSASKTPAAAAVSFGDKTKSTEAKALIATYKKSQKSRAPLKEHTPSLNPKSLNSEIERAAEISKMSFAPQPTQIDYTIFDEDKVKSLNLKDALLDFNNSRFSSNPTLDRCLGSMYGMVIGDAWGHLLEFVPVQYEKEIIREFDAANYKYPEVLNRFRLKPGQWTDDTSMGLCLADSLLVKGHVDAIDLRKRFVMWWYLGYNNAFRHDTQWRENKSTNGRSVGLGGQIGHSLHAFKENPTLKYADGADDMSGNGSIMRLAPLPLFFRDADLEELVCESMHQSYTTHSGVQSAECAALLSYVIVSALKTPSLTGKEFLDQMDFEPLQGYFTSDTMRCIAGSRQNTEWKEDNYNKVEEDQNWNWKDPGYRYSPTRSAINPGYVGGYACDNIAMALHCVYHTTDFKSAVLRCINRCGDADTVGSVTGQIAGALYGFKAVPRSALECIFNWDPNGEIAVRVMMMFGSDVIDYK